MRMMAMTMMRLMMRMIISREECQECYFAKNDKNHYYHECPGPRPKQILNIIHPKQKKFNVCVENPNEMVEVR